MAQTNAQIIFNQSIELMEKGVIGSTGRMIKVLTASGEEKEIQEPEAIHTFAMWKELGRVVKKGEHAKAQFVIWKAAKHHTELEDKNGNKIEEESTKMFMKKAFFFTLDQTEELKKEKATA